MPWMRCTQKTPCAICGKTRYCTYKPEAGVAKCTQIDEGAFRVSKDASGPAYFHRHDYAEWKPTPVSPPISNKKDGSTNWEKLVKAACNAPRRLLVRLSGEIGIPVQTLVDWRVGYFTQRQLRVLKTTCSDSGAWTFPMRSWKPPGKTIGIRLRTPLGFKYAVKGSSPGLFYNDLDPSMGLAVVDGVTDAMAGDSVGLNIVGRPSSTSGQKMMKKLIKRLDPTSLHVMLDRDDISNPMYEQMFDAANDLARTCRLGYVFYSPSPYKDLRQWLTKHPKSLPSRKLSRLVSTCTKTAKL